ncbi:MAG: S41 family peptidase [Planctomycetota bacterium]
MTVVAKPLPAQRVADAATLSERSRAKPDTPVLTADGAVAAAIRGVWQASAYGYVLDLSEARPRRFSVCGAGAWEHEEDGSPDLWFGVEASGDRGVVTMHPLEPGFDVERLGALPPACAEPTDWTQTRLFGAVVATMAEFYPFFEVRGFDWEARVAALRPQVTDGMADAALFAVFESLFRGLGDGHVFMQAEIDGEGRLIRAEDRGLQGELKAAFAAQSAVAEWPTFRRTWLRTLKGELYDGVLAGEQRGTANERLIWGKADERVGYLMITGMHGYSTSDDIDENVRALHQGLDEVLGELGACDALIVDVSMNHGGADLFSLEIASRFADEKRLAFSKYPAKDPSLIRHRHVTPYVDRSPGAVMFTKPVYVVTHVDTASAAEIFTMAMRALPHVTTVGRPTSGALSDILDKELPNGWSFGLSNEVYTDHRGVCHEGRGIPPDVAMDIFDPEDITQHGHADAIAKIVEMAKQRLAAEAAASDSGR